jgi:light-regulated signal transduction histidine kinase (bacteriophytochrome)
MGMVYGDRNLLGLVWTNLIANSLKFTRNTESGRIQIGANNGVFFINDNGVGFDPKYKDKLFGVFQRLHLESEFEGTGIGLANVKRIVNRHGGDVFADAVLKKGAKFSFSIPPL